MQPTTDVAPPGARAPLRPTPAQKKVVQGVLRAHADDLLHLERSQVHALLPVFKQAEIELQHDLKKWITTAPNGELRWTAWKYRGAIVQLRAGTSALEQAVLGRIEAAGDKAQPLALDHMQSELARFSTVFGGSIPKLRLDLAALVAEGKSSLVPHYESSAERYAWGREKGVWQDINKRLAVDILAGAPLHRTIDRLQEEGGPRGLVALRGVAGEENAIVELIPEGLFARYRWRAEMYVRTEMAGAYGAQMRLGFDDALKILPDLMRRWSTDGSGCSRICAPMDGQVVGPNEPFIDGEGGTVDQDGGAHPNCRCRWSPWREHWGELLDSLGIN